MDIIELLAFTVKKKASDLHISADLPPICRIDGALRRLAMSSLSQTQIFSLLQSIMSAKQFKILADQLDIDFSFEIKNLSRFRANVYHQRKGLAAVFRPIARKVPTLQELGLPKVIQQLTQLKNGLILVTGPTGCGKSTTLAAMIDFINEKNACHIITIEDPVEYIFESKKSLISQREIYQDSRDFNSALRAGLREDPDIIFVGELRDSETIRLALTAAETGHLVLASLHTTSAAKTINRIVDVFSAAEKDTVRTMLAESLQAVIAQVLINNIPQGRTAALEIMLCTPAIRHLIRENKIAQIYSVIQAGQTHGMQTFQQHLQQLNHHKETT
ncbi:MAG: type IV pilus twitching motility protein PilT [Gammaproteobacteria bacterium]